MFCLHHLGRWSTPAYARTDVPAHLISVLPVGSGRSKENYPTSFDTATGRRYRGCLKVLVVIQQHYRWYDGPRVQRHSAYFCKLKKGSTLYQSRFMCTVLS